MVTSRAQANLLGNIHGGEIVKLADSAAGVVAQRHSGGPAVTAALDEMAFLEPVRVGDIVRTFAQINWAGRSSMEIGVRVETQPWDDATRAASRRVGVLRLRRDRRRRRGAPVPPLRAGERRGRAADAGGRDPARAPARQPGRDRGGRSDG